MNERSSFIRKVIYGVLIAMLLFPLALLSAPATRTDAGGILARLRTEYGISQADLGEVDPASETIKLATLGLRGIAVNLLWEKANYYKMTEDWTNLTATLEQLAKLQPNFITFWKFQAWNLSYNVSVEFDDYHDRYYYVRRGIEFLQEGERYNKDNPNLLSDLGWFIGQKIGRADEYVQYRRLFKADDDFHPADRPPEQRDNWLVGKMWYEKAVDAVDNKGRSLGRKSPRIFFESPAKSQINYSEAIEEEGSFEKARRAWTRASEEWRQFGQRVIPHSSGVKLQLGNEAQVREEVNALTAKLDALMPTARAQVAELKRASLTKEERDALKIPPPQLTSDQQSTMYAAQRKLQVTTKDVADYIAKQDPEKAKEALRLGNELEREELRLQYTINYKDDSNYDFWQTRCDLEQTANALSARDLMFRARQAFHDGDIVGAKKLFEEGFAKWRLVFDEFPLAIENDLIVGDDVIRYIKQYRQVLDQLDETISDDFPLWDAIEKFDTEAEFKDEVSEHKQRMGQGKQQKAETKPETQPEAKPDAK
jgi:hypothetical protein